jgi:hypothetical protein
MPGRRKWWRPRQLRDRQPVNLRSTAYYLNRYLDTGSLAIENDAAERVGPDDSGGIAPAVAGHRSMPRSGGQAPSLPEPRTTLLDGPDPKNLAHRDISAVQLGAFVQVGV